MIAPEGARSEKVMNEKFDLRLEFLNLHDAAFKYLEDNQAIVTKCNDEVIIDGVERIISAANGESFIIKDSWGDEYIIRKGDYQEVKIIL